MEPPARVGPGSWYTGVVRVINNVQVKSHPAA